MTSRALVDTAVVTVLVADDDARSRRLAVGVLRQAGYRVELATSVKQALSVLRRRRVGAIVVDPQWAAPSVAAVDLIQELRRMSDIPVVVVSTLAGPDMVAVLNAGADDYVAKPFGIDELLARVRAALRRGATTTAEPPVVTADFQVDLRAHRFWLSDQSEVLLTPTEWRIVEALVRRPGFVIGHADLLEQVWGPTARQKTEYLRVYVAAIRKKIEPDPTRPRYFVTYPGVGHVFLPNGRPTGPSLGAALH